MAQIKLEDVNSLRAWMFLVTNNDDCFEVPEIDLQLSLYGVDDSTYMVIDIYTGARSCTQYVFSAAKEEEENKSLVLIFDLLKYVSFSLEELVNWLKVTPYIESEMGEKIEAFGLIIYKRDVISNA
jgi:hypothetical protein